MKNNMILLYPRENVMILPFGKSQQLVRSILFIDFSKQHISHKTFIFIYIGSQDRQGVIAYKVKIASDKKETILIKQQTQSAVSSQL